MDLSSYETIAFDCDGIILDSNKVKTNAFYNATVTFSEKAAIAIRDYHVANGGISRFKKFEWVTNEYLSHLDFDDTYNTLLKSYANEVSHGLSTCEINPALTSLKALTPNAKWLVVSGGAQTELRELFRKRELDKLFPNGIFGSPDSKDVIFERELANTNISGKTLFIGDSKYDFYSSTNAGLDFVFINEWTEVKDWKEFCDTNKITYFTTLSELASSAD